MAGLTLGWMQLASLLGALQGIFLAGVLFVQRQNRTANRVLAALMLAFSVYLGSEVYYATAAFRTYPHFFGVSYQMPWIFGPLVYLYAVAASDRSWRFGWRALWHFVPVLLSVIIALPYYALSGPDKVAMFDRMMAGDVPRAIVLIDPFKYVVGVAYSVATALHVRRHRRLVEYSYSNPARVNLSWLLWLTGSGAAIWLLAILVGVTALGQQLNDDYVALAIAVLVYATGYMGLRQPEVFRYETAEYPVPMVLMPNASQSAAVEPEAAPRRTERPGMAAHESSQLKESLLALMDDEQPWKDSELTLADLAIRLETTPHKVSEVLNANVGQTFHDFVNGYRVREVQRRIRAGDGRSLKMLALALDAGFASKSTFNQAFKKHTNQTPSDFQAAL